MNDVETPSHHQNKYKNIKKHHTRKLNFGEYFSFSYLRNATQTYHSSCTCSNEVQLFRLEIDHEKQLYQGFFSKVINDEKKQPTNKVQGGSPTSNTLELYPPINGPNKWVTGAISALLLTGHTAHLVRLYPWDHPT